MVKISLATLNQVISAGVAILEDVELFEKEFLSIQNSSTIPANSTTSVNPVADTTPTTGTNSASYTASPV